MRFQTRCLKSLQRTLRPGSNRSALSRALHRCLLRPGQVQLTSLGRLKLCLLSCRFWGKASYGFSGECLRDRLRSAKISQGKALVRFSRWREARRIWIGEAPRSRVSEGSSLCPFVKGAEAGALGYAGGKGWSLRLL